MQRKDEIRSSKYVTGTLVSASQEKETMGPKPGKSHVTTR